MFTKYSKFVVSDPEGNETLAFVEEKKIKTSEGLTSSNDMDIYVCMFSVLSMYKYLRSKAPFS